MNDRPSIYTSFHCDNLFESVGMRSHYLHGMNRIWFYVKPGQEWPRKEAVFAHQYAWRTYTWLFCVHMYVCLSACTCVCACMWYLGVCCWGPLRRSMLTRGAAGPPDVPIPARLVTRGPLLLSPYCTQICTHIQDFFIRLYIADKQRTWMKSVSVQLHSRVMIFFSGAQVKMMYVSEYFQSWEHFKYSCQPCIGKLFLWRWGQSTPLVAISAIPQSQWLILFPALGSMESFSSWWIMVGYFSWCHDPTWRM